jgi:hypothetical protein
MGVATGGRLSVGAVTAERGTLATGWLPIGDDWQRGTQAVPIAVLNGRAEGPVLGLQAVSDGDELNGLAVIREILRQVSPADLSGAVICALVANPGAFAAGQTADPRDGRKLNRCFPGDPEGSVSERLAHRLLQQFALRCDLLIDLHQNGEVPMLPEVRVRTGRHGALHADCLELALAMGWDYILDQQGPAGQLARVAPSLGIPTIDPELGGNVGFDPAMVELGARGIQRVLLHYRLLDGDLPPAPRPYLARRLCAVAAPCGGILELRRKLGERVHEGDLLAEVADVFGSGRVPVLSPADGVLWLHRQRPVVTAGETVCAVGRPD